MNHLLPRLLALSLLATSLIFPTRGGSQPYDPVSGLLDHWIPDGPVNALAIEGSTLYLGGHFDSLAPRTGSAVPIDRVSGEPVAAWAEVAGGSTTQDIFPDVGVAVADGSGGWFLGGTFTTVAGAPRAGLAHVLSDGSLDLTWDPAPGISAGSHSISALAYANGILYVGGQFTEIGGASRSRIAALDAATGLATPWDPGANGSPYTLVVDSGLVYAGGIFTNIGGSTRARIAALDASTGLATAWNPASTNIVYALVKDGSTIYAGGDFTSIGGQPRSRLAALDTSTGLATSWDPGADNTVGSLVLDGSTLYAAGRFTTIGGATRPYLAAVDTTTGLATSWNPSPDQTVEALVVDGSEVLVGGAFTAVGGEARARLAAISSTTGLASNWELKVRGTVHTLALAGTKLMVGGEFSSIGGLDRKRLAALDIDTGLATDWDPQLASPPGEGLVVNSLIVNDGTVYVGGSFGLIRGTLRQNLGAIDATTGLATPWAPVLPMEAANVQAMAMHGGAIYISADPFQEEASAKLALGSITAAYETTSGAATGWNAQPDNYIGSLVPHGSNLLVAGHFSSVGGAARESLAAVNPTTGIATAWNPGANHIVRGLVAEGTTAYAAGIFTALGGASRNYVGAVDTTTGAATAWQVTGLDSTTDALALDGSVIYISGSFSTLGGKSLDGLAAVDRSTAAPLAWDPRIQPGAWVRHLAIDGDLLVAAYRFRSVGGTATSHVALFRTSPLFLDGFESGNTSRWSSAAP